MNRRTLKTWLLGLATASIPLATVGTCDYSPYGASFFLDQHAFDYDDDYDDEFYVEDVYYVDDGYYIDDYCCFP